MVPSDRTRVNGHKPKDRRFPMNIRKVFYYCATEHWHRSPREVVTSPSMEIFKSHLNTVLGNWL